MLGPVRFVNSDCNPNAEYDFSSENKVVKLRSLRSINPKEEILVKYSEDFFESYCCLCRSCQSKTSEKDVLSPKVVELFTSFVDDEIKKIVIDLIEEQQIQIASKVPRPKRSKLSWFQKVQAFSQAYETQPICSQMAVNFSLF